MSNDDELDFDAWLDRVVGVTKATYSGDSDHTKWLKEAVEQVKTELKICFGFGKDGKSWEGTYQREGYLEKASRLAQIGDVVNKANRANVSLDDLLTMVKEVHEQIEANDKKVI